MIAAAATATTAASAVSTLASASATTAATRSAASTTATTARTAAPTSAFAHRASLIHHQRTAQKILAIAGLNGALGFFVVAEFREAETTRLTGKLIADNLNGIGLESVPREPVL
jgi:hypothetical protein